MKTLVQTKKKKSKKATTPVRGSRSKACDTGFARPTFPYLLTNIIGWLNKKWLTLIQAKAEKLLN